MIGIGSRADARQAPRRRPPIAALLWVLVAGGLAHGAGLAAGEPPGEAPGGLEVGLAAATVTDPVDAPVRAVEVAERADVLALYHQAYLPAGDVRAQWSGNLATCNPGSLSPEFQQAVLRRINYFRAMAGVPGDVVLTTAKNAKAQESALMMAAAGQLSHFPAPGWPCYTADGAEAAGNGNLSLGRFGPEAIDGLIADTGANNAPVGHRRWLLYPPSREMGNGSVPTSPGANVVWVIGDFGPRPAGPEWTSWPPPGHVPQELIYPRWSFSHPRADFSGARVFMEAGGQPLATALEPLENGFGDNTLVWVPAALPEPEPGDDASYRVTIDRVLVDGGAETFSYEVVAMDPWRLEAPPRVSGPVHVDVGQQAVYGITATPGANAYQVRSARRIRATWSEGGEQGTAFLVDGTHPAYSVIDVSEAASGSASLHLTLPDFEAQTVTLDRDVIPLPGSRLELWSRFGFVTTTTTLHAEVSGDDGNTWHTVWSRSGGSDRFATDQVYSFFSVPLDGFAGTRLRVRFRLAATGPAFLGSDPDFGVHLDEIRLTASDELVDQRLVLLEDAGEVAFAPPVPGSYQLDARPRIGESWLPFGPRLVVTAAATPAPRASFDQASGLLHLPAVALPNGQMLRADLTRSDPGAWSFELVRTGEATPTATPPATYDPATGRVTVPEVRLAPSGLRFRVELDLEAASAPVSFRLVDAEAL